MENVVYWRRYGAKTNKQINYLLTCWGLGCFCWWKKF